jgi:hypothetical protein
MKVSAFGSHPRDGRSQCVGESRHVQMRARVRAAPALITLLLVAVALAPGCGSSRRAAPPSGIPLALLLQARAIGRGAHFHPPASGPVIGRCRRRLGPRSGVHLEVFAANRVVLVPAGIGTRPPWTLSAGRISGANCYGDLVTLEPTGLLLVRAGVKLSLSDLFRAWGQPLSQHRLAAFPAPARTRVAVFVNGRRWHGSPTSVALAVHSEIVLEVGPYVPPHHSYAFPPGT